MQRTLIFAPFCALLILAVAAVPAGAAPIAPAATPIKGDLVEIGTLFHLNYWNLRITRIAWEPATSPLGKAVGDATPMDEGNGLLVFTVAIKNASATTQDILFPSIQILFKDGTQSSDDNRQAYRENASGELSGGDYQPGQGLTVRLVIPNIPQPTAANPVTKILIKPYNGSANDSGAANVFRLLNPSIG